MLGPFATASRHTPIHQVSRLKRSSATEKRDENESVYYDATEQQLHELQAEQHDGTVRDETD